MVTAERLADIEQERRRALAAAKHIADTASTPQDRIAFEKLLDWVFELDDFAGRFERNGPWRIK